MDDFRRGATAMKNASDLAKKHRDRFTQGANSISSQARTAAAQADTASRTKHREISTHHEYMDPIRHSSLPNADSRFQYITDASLYESEDTDEAPIIPRSPCTEKDSQDTSSEASQEASQEPVSLGDYPSMSIISSFTSGFRGSKRSKRSLGPPSQSSGSRDSKTRMRPSTALRTVIDMAVCARFVLKNDYIPVESPRLAREIARAAQQCHICCNRTVRGSIYIQPSHHQPPLIASCLQSRPTPSFQPVQAFVFHDIRPPNLDAVPKQLSFQPASQLLLQ